jgi:tRNA 2-thiouridine synthesizing protein A
MSDHHLDLKGLKCPLPALRTGKALNGLAPGEVLHVTCTDGMAAIDIPHLIQQRGDRLLEYEAAKDHLYFMIERGTPKEPSTED